ncbi:S-layer homology domain-containing protein [Pleurocapsa sp. FMAR1]|uniref:S-layer homology domain-containing protein n=1 Tax=Pleurocapsa sp. FMAR1 TaxID=3040204 RepID=UPI0029C9477D|nr:S-layer homology domain-containing protein [Pleurocapsa sp. FMAR1]
MLLKQNKRVIKNIIFTSLLALLTGCGNSNALESFVGADPGLLKNNGKQLSQQTANQGKPSTANDHTQNKPADNQAKVSESQGESTSQSSALPQNFPKSFPLYPQAQLKEAKRENETSGRLTWDSPDRQKAIADYYEAKLAANDWKIIKPFNLNPQLETAKAIAVKNDLRVDLALVRSPNKANNNGTEISVIYQPIEADIGRGNSQGINSQGELSQTLLKSKSQQQTNSSNQEQKSKTQSPKLAVGDQPSNTSDTKSSNSSGVDFQDLDQAPEQLRQPLESVAALDILTPYTGDGNVELSKFAPNKIITRGEYARWLITANNRYFQDSLDKKIYLATATNEPAFQDVKPNNPDFEAIQSLAETGLIPSRLTEDSNNVLFKPDAPLTREDLLAWKVPLDMRQSLPKASIEAIKESWGFQDAGNIDSTAIRALYADFQNGDRSNVRRIFGYTTLFQPKKPVTRAEAAASLWYFGFQGDGVTAKEILETKSNS